MTTKYESSNTLQIAVVGNVDSGKSTLISTLKYELLDNGNGSARSKIVTLKHEHESGRTSSVTIVSMDQFNLIDLAGHEKYLRTTLEGLTRYFPDYALLVIDSNDGITKMTLEHLYVCLALRIPFMVVLNKIDQAPERQLKSSLTEVERTLKRNRIKFSYKINSKDDISSKRLLYIQNAFSVIPIFFTSCLKGNGLDLLRTFLLGLPSKPVHSLLQNYLKTTPIETFFHIYKVYFKDGIGYILYGRLLKGEIGINDQLKIGPRLLESNEYARVRVRSIHNSERENVSTLKTDQNGCLAIKSLNNKLKLNKGLLRGGRVCLGLKDDSVAVTKFEAVIMISNHATTIRTGFCACIHTETSQCVATLINSEKEVLRSKDRSEVTFEFLKTQFIYPGARIIFREGSIRGIGIVTKV